MTRYDVEFHPPRLFYTWVLIIWYSPSRPFLPCTFSNTADPLTTRADYSGSLCDSGFHTVHLGKITPVVHLLTTNTLSFLTLPFPWLSQSVLHLLSIHLILSFSYISGFSLLLGLSPSQPLSAVAFLTLTLRVVRTA